MELKQEEKEFYTELLENNLKFIESELKKDPQIKKAAESIQNTVSPEVKQQIGNFTIRTKADLLRQYSSLKVNTDFIKSEARYNLNSDNNVEFFLYKNYEVIPIKTTLNYRVASNELLTNIDAPITETLSVKLDPEIGQKRKESLMFHFKTNF